jgi:hypothetical protein
MIGVAVRVRLAFRVVGAGGSVRRRGVTSGIGHGDVADQIWVLEANEALLTADVTA